MKIALAMAGTEQSKTEQRRISFPDLPPFHLGSPRRATSPASEVHGSIQLPMESDGRRSTIDWSRSGFAAGALA
jgi:hypothetical protein